MKQASHKTAWHELLAILLARLSFLWLLVLLSMLSPWDNAAFHAFMAIAFIITIPYSLWLRNKIQTQQFAPLQFLVDLVLVTGLIYFTGGISSELTLLYPLVILSAGMVAKPRQAAEITLLGIVMYVLMSAMLSQNLLVEYLPAGTEPATGNLFAAVTVRVFAFALFGALSVYLSKRCNYTKERRFDARNATKSMLNGLSANALLLNEQGRIVHANKMACDSLKIPMDELCTYSFADIRSDDREPIPSHHGQTTHLKRTEAPLLPVSYHTEDIRISAVAVPGMDENEEDITLTLVTFNDLSKSIILEKQLHKVEQVATATRFAGEMAHEIRTPLTSISASIQLLKHYEEKTSASDWLPNSGRRKDRAELFDHITSAYDQMDSIIQNFIDLAEYSPNDLISIIKLDSIDENKSYIGQLNTKSRGFKHGPNSDSGRRSYDP